MEKVEIEIKDGKATVTKGADSFIGKLLAASGGNLKVNLPRTKGEFKLTKKVKEKK